MPKGVVVKSHGAERLGKGKPRGCHVWIKGIRVALIYNWRINYNFRFCERLGVRFPLSGRQMSYLFEQKWVDQSKLVIAGHSQGSKVAAKIAGSNSSVTHLGLFSANPFGRCDESIRKARFDARTKQISWDKADSIINEQYSSFKNAHDSVYVKKYPFLKAVNTFSEIFYDDWLALDIPIYLAYGTEDMSTELCDIIPLFFIKENKDNLTLNRYLGLKHNFFEMNTDGRPNYEKGHWIEVMNEFIDWTIEHNMGANI